jgi:dipeptidyl aminopeptidase/acylaminoacyl peptidase
MSLRFARTALSVLCTFMPMAVLATDLIPVEDFARHPQLLNPRLSPDGAHLAVRMDDPASGNFALAVFAVDDMSKPKSLLRMPRYQIPLSFTWVSPTRLVVQKGKQSGSLDVPTFYGEVLATDLDGKHIDYIYGYENAGSRATTRQGDQGWGIVVGQPSPSNGHVYLETESWDNKGHYALYDVDTVKNSRRLIGDIDVDGMSFMVGADGDVRFAYGANENYDYVVYRRTNGAWSLIDTKNDNRTFAPITFAPDKKRIYAFYSKDGGPSQLVEQEEDGNDRKVLAKDSFGSVSLIQWTALPSQPFATATDTGVPTPSYIAPELPAAKLHMALSRIFKGFVNFIDYSEDGSRLLFEVSSDRDPGTYYVMDTKTNKVNKLFSPYSWIDPQRMAERRPLRFKASDGTELEAILTLPPGRGETNLPMVLLPHGGPHGVNDDWFYENDAQFLANRGYLVLQVNYRGSGGRGRNFNQSGFLKWGTRIQQDLIDGVKWAIAENYADAHRVCAYGASFGGYSAMMATIRAPGLFQCAVGYAGIYDLAMMYKKGDVKEDKSGRSYLSTVIGKDDADLAANSPTHLADKIDVPVLLIHGEDDKRAPFAQAKAMRAALDAAHKPYQWLSKPGEGHGFYDEKNRVEFYNTLQSFLDKHIGPKAGTTAGQLSQN